MSGEDAEKASIFSNIEYFHIFWKKLNTATFRMKLRREFEIKGEEKIERV